MHNIDLCESLLNKKYIESFSYQNIADKVGTPLYVYSGAKIISDFKILNSVLPDDFNYFYSLKANPNKSIIQIMEQLGIGCEVCSLTELEVAIHAGMDHNKVIFVGPGKSVQELRRCVQLKIKAVIVESLSELALLNNIAKEEDVCQPIGIRINPDFISKNARLSMSGRASQFGIDEAELDQLYRKQSEYSNIELSGVQVYLGTRILNANSIVENVTNIFSLAKRIQKNIDTPLKFVDVGGGLGVPYFQKEKPLDLAYLGKLLIPLVHSFRTYFPTTHIIMELGRFLVARAGVFVTRIRYIKSSKGKLYAICDGGSNCHGAAAGLAAVIRKNFPIVKLGERNRKTKEYMITGPLCTPTDLIGDSVSLPELKVGDLIGIFHSGAYGPTASPVNFLGFGNPIEVLINNGQVKIIRKRETLEQVLFAQETQTLNLSTDSQTTHLKKVHTTEPSVFI